MDDKTQPKNRLLTAARRALLAANKDYHRAALILREMARFNDELREQIYVVGLATSIRDAANDDRKRIGNDIINELKIRSKEAVSERMEKYANMTTTSARYRGSFGITLPGGLMLGDAIFEDVAKAQNALQKQLNGVQKKIIFYKEIMQRCEELDEKIASKWSENELDNVYKTIYGFKKMTYRMR